MAGQVYVTGSLGGLMSQPYLSDKLRHKAQPMFRWRQFVEPKEAIGLKRGNTFLFDKAGNVGTQGGTLVETSTIPRTEFTVGQGTAVITEYGNAVPWTGKVEALVQWDLPPLVEQKLRDDMVKVLESACGAQYAATDFIAVNASTTSVTFTTNGTATATAGANLTAKNVRAINDFMKKKLIPYYDGSHYICIASVAALSGLHDDTGTGGWVDVSKYTGEFAKNIHNGEVGQYYKTKFVEETGYLSNAIGTGSVFGQACFFGSDTVYEAIAIPEEIRTDTPTDFQRFQALAWYALLGFKIVWNFAADAEQHIVYCTSA